MASPSAPTDPEPEHDPRDIVTPYAFEVDPALLGAQLASSGRRLAALLLDLLIAAVVASLGGVLLGFAVALLFFRFATRPPEHAQGKRWNRAAAFAGACVLFITVLVVTGGDSEPDSPPDVPAMVSNGMQMGELDSVRDSVATVLAQHGVDAAALETANLPPALTNLIATVTAPRAPRSSDDRAQAASVLRTYADAVAEDDRARIDSLQVQATRIVAGDQLRRLRQRLRAQRTEVERLEDENDELAEQAANPGLWRTARATGEEFGLGLGWLGVYFTLSMAWWNGRTIGKRLFGLRVVRLNGEPLTLWFAFERFGGYAAGIATGLLGFAQIWWDPNRQGIHDRIAGTVVLHERKRAATP